MIKLLKNEQIVQQNDEKTLSTIQSNIIQENENQLINEEQKLIEEEKILKDKLLNVNLIYKKIMENIDYFIKEMKSDDEKQKEEKTKKKNIILMILMITFFKKLQWLDNPQYMIQIQQKMISIILKLQ